jgi:predicted DNA-binding transcriptional regulator AlpA
VNGSDTAALQPQAEGDCWVSISEYERRLGASKSTILRKIKLKGWPGPVCEDGNFVRYSLNAIKALQAQERLKIESRAADNSQPEARA